MQKNPTMTNQQVEQPPSPDGLYHDPVFHHCVDLLSGEEISINDVIHGIPVEDDHACGVVLRMFMAYTPRGRDVYAKVRLMSRPGKPTITYHLDQVACNLQDSPEKP